MKKLYVVEKHSTEITTEKAARMVYEGMTLAADLNRGNLSPDEEYRFTNEQEARVFLNKQTNDYYYNGSGCGRAVEWYLSEQLFDDDGEWCGDCGGYDDCPHSNIEEFKARHI